MLNLNPVSRSATHAVAPTAQDLKPPPLQYTAQQASPAAAIDSVQADAAKGNMVANMHGGWVPDKRGIVHIITTKASRSNKKTSRSKSRSRSGSRTIRRGGKRGRRFRKQGRSFKRRVSRRIRMRLLERHIKKHSIGSNAMMQKMMRGGNNDTNDTANIGGGDRVPQHGASCSGSADPNCPGNAAASLLDATRQATANAHGDSI